MSMKAKILELLREKKDRVAAGAPESEAYVSGQELCERSVYRELRYGKPSDN